MPVLSEFTTRELRGNLSNAIRSGEVLPAAELTPHLLHSEETVRRLALELLERSADPASVPALLDATADASFEVSIAATELLRSLSDPAVAAPLTAGLSHPAAEARLAAVVALRKHRPPAAIPALVLALGDSESTIRREVVLTLAAYRAPDLVTALRSALRDSSALVRRAAVGVLPDFDSAFVFDDLILALDDEDWQVRREAARGLRRFPGQAALAALLRESLHDEAWQVVREAALGLGSLRARIDHRLVNRLQHPASEVRAAAATTLGESGEVAWRHALEPLLQDADAAVRAVARHAFAKLSS